MNRPDLDYISKEAGRIHTLTEESDVALFVSEEVPKLIAYARHLEARISELETALEPFALGWVIGDAELKDRTARVLRKGE